MIDVESLIAEAISGAVDMAQVDAVAGPMNAEYWKYRIAKLAARALLSPTPTGDERERAVTRAYNDIVGHGDIEWSPENTQSALEQLYDSAAGFRVAPEPVYEYGVAFPNGYIHASRSRMEAENEIDDWNSKASLRRKEANGQASYGNSALRRRTQAVQAGPWLPVVSTSKEQEDD